jgi:hypothetical protein
MDKAETDIGQTVANSRKINAERERIFAETTRIKGETNKIDFLVKQIKAEIRKINAGTMLTYEQTAESINKQYLIKQQTDLFFRQTLKALQEERIIKMDADIQQQLYNMKPGNASNLLKLLMSMRGRR